MIALQPAVRLARDLTWAEQGGRCFLAAAGALTKAEARAPSPLPGWTRAHVISHVSRNAEAVGNLLHWAATGIETPMYRDPAQRASDIERWARLPLPQVLQHCRVEELRLQAAIESLPDQAWDAEVRTAQGRDVRASEVVWLRVREVWVHAVDLGIGVTFETVPNDVKEALVDDVVAWRSRDDACPRAELHAAGRRWALGEGAGDRSVVHGSLDDLVAWLLGRSSVAGLHVDGPVPDLPRWL